MDASRYARLVLLRVAVPRPPSEVFRRVADFGRLAEWDPAVSAVTLEGGRALVPGARYRLVTTWGGMQLEYELVELVTPVRAVYRGGSARVTSTDTISCEPAGTGTLVTIESDVTFGGWTRLVSPLIRVALWLTVWFGSRPALRRHLR